jgi:hypothetical protein
VANKWTDMVFCLLDMQPVPKAVLSALAFHSNNDSGQSWPSVPLLARETGYKETAVKKAIKLLNAERIISKVGTKPCKNGDVNVWEINGVAVQRGLDTTGSLYVAPQGRSTTGTGAGDDPYGVARRRRNSSLELSREHVRENSSSGSDDAPHLGSKAGSKPKPMTADDLQRALASVRVTKADGLLSETDGLEPDDEVSDTDGLDWIEPEYGSSEYAKVSDTDGLD